MPASRPQSRLQRLLPAPLNIPRKEWLRAGFGALLGLFLAGYLCSLAYGPSIALHLLGPLAASAVLVFAVGLAGPGRAQALVALRVKDVRCTGWSDRRLCDLRGCMHVQLHPF